MRPTILIHNESPSINGNYRIWHQISLHLAKDFRVIRAQMPEQNPLIDARANAGISHIFLSSSLLHDPSRTLSAKAEAAGIFSVLGPDLIVFVNATPFASFAAIEAAAFLGIPYLIFEGTASQELALQLPNYLKAVAGHYSWARRVIAKSQQSQGILQQHFGLLPEMGRSIHPGVEAKFFAPVNNAIRMELRSRIRVPDNGIIVFTATHLDSQKGFDIILKSIENLKNKEIWPRLYFVWAGSGPLLSPLSKEIERLGLEGRVRLLGQQENIADWLDASDIYLLPLRIGDVPLSLIEAMAKGLPIIASAVGGIGEILGDCGYLLPDPRINPDKCRDALETALTQLAQNSELRLSSGAKAKFQAISNFRQERMLEEILTEIRLAFLFPSDDVPEELPLIKPDRCFPFLAWQKEEGRKARLCDMRYPTIAFPSRSEALWIHKLAIDFQDRRALQIGCGLGWISAHLALAKVALDVVDPRIAAPNIAGSVIASLEELKKKLEENGETCQVALHAGPPLWTIPNVAKGNKWDMIIIEGGFSPEETGAIITLAESYAGINALILGLSLGCPEISDEMIKLEERGFRVRTIQGGSITLAARGNVR